jgi:hypothetical protein
MEIISAAHFLGLKELLQLASAMVAHHLTGTVQSCCFYKLRSSTEKGARLGGQEVSLYLAFMNYSSKRGAEIDW